MQGSTDKDLGFGRWVFICGPIEVEGIPYSARNVAQPVFAVRGGFSENLQLSRNRTDLLDQPKCNYSKWPIFGVQAARNLRHHG
jgi:hypothetical protein